MFQESTKSLVQKQGCIQGTKTVSVISQCPDILVTEDYVLGVDTELEGQKPNGITDFDGILMNTWILNLDWFQILALLLFSCVTLGILHNFCASVFCLNIFEI